MYDTSISAWNPHKTEFDMVADNVFFDITQQYLI